MKKCPYCAEEIQDAALVCWHCNRKMPGAKVPGEDDKLGCGWAGISILIPLVGWIAAIAFFISGQKRKATSVLLYSLLGLILAIILFPLTGI